MEDTTCVHMSTFDVAATAGLYSQLAGVLAGFAFAALVVILTSRLAAERPQLADSETSRTLTSCFLGLILVSLSYAVLAGETTNAGRAAMVQLVAAPGFIAAGMLLLLSILAILSVTEGAQEEGVASRTGSTHMLRVLLAHVTPVILIASLLGGVDDYADARWGNHQFRTIDTVTVVAGALVILVPLAAYAPWPRGRYSTPAWHPRTFSYVAVGLAAAAATGTFLVSASLGPCQTLGQWFAVLVITPPVLFIILLSTYLIKSRPQAASTKAVLVSQQ